MSETPAAAREERPRLRPWHALALLPAAGVFLGVPFANRVRPFVLGLPFLLAWILGCVLLTSLVMAVIGVLDRRERRAASRPGASPPGPRA